MSKKYIKLIGPVFHNKKEYTADAVLAIPQCITELEADRLIRLGIAEICVPFITENATNQNNSNKTSVAEMIKLDCQNELTKAGVQFDKKASRAELQKLVFEHRKSLEEQVEQSDDTYDDIDINLLTRDELETELTARAIEFTAEQSDDELRQLLIDDESDNDE